MTEDEKASKLARARDRNTCRFGLPGCTRRATGVHHIYGRMILHLRYNLLNLLSACQNCHCWIEENPVEGHEVCRKVMCEFDWNELHRIAKNIEWEKEQ